MKPDSFDKAYSTWTKAKEREGKARIATSAALSELDKARRDIVLVCECGHENRAGDVELIEELRNGHRECGGDNWTYTYVQYFACAGCGELQDAPVKDKLFPENFRNYVKSWHEWDSGSCCASGRVAELLAPSRAREAKRRAERDKRDKIEEAKRVLREAGEL